MLNLEIIYAFTVWDSFTSIKEYVNILTWTVTNTPTTLNQIYLKKLIIIGMQSIKLCEVLMISTQLE